MHQAPRLVEVYSSELYHFKDEVWKCVLLPLIAGPSVFGNVYYYHCWPQCIWIHNSYFIPKTLVVPDDIFDKLDSVHKDYLMLVFGINL